MLNTGELCCNGVGYNIYSVIKYRNALYWTVLDITYASEITHWVLPSKFLNGFNKKNPMTCPSQIRGPLPPLLR